MAIDPKVFKQVRKVLGLSQQELAYALGLSRVTVNKMERGRLRRGIPDNVADHLMALKGPSDGAIYRSSQKPDPELDAEVRRIINDAHLWDNEEDES